MQDQENSTTLKREPSTVMAAFVLLFNMCVLAIAQDAATNIDLESRFTAADTNEDGLLSLEELLSEQPEAQRAKLKRDFLVVDWNHDSGLSLEEYSAIPGVVPASERIGVPDPLLDLSNAYIHQVQNSWQTWDSNGDGFLNNEEYSTGNLQRTVKELAATEFKLWDLDGDGKLTESESIKVIEAAFGIRRLDGAAYRESSGITYNIMLFEHTDENRDDILSLKEYVERGQAGEKAQERFQLTDTNGDGAMTFLEFTKGSIENNFRIDPIATFIAADVDLSGGLTQAEVLAGTPEWQHGLTKHYLKVFDDDDSGELSLDEYRLVPTANFFTTWQYSPYDKDGEGELSFNEFHTSGKLELSGLSMNYFTRYDQNNSGTLDRSEFTFLTTARDPDFDFPSADSNGDKMLTLEEYLSTGGDPKAETRDFSVFDTNRDELISTEEYLAIPAKTTISQRLNSSDPIVKLAEDRLVELNAAFKEADSDRNDQLDADEFRTARLSRKLPGLVLSRFKDWDLNSDGVLTENELRRFVEAAFGVRRLDGTAYREPSGVTYNAMVFGASDLNKDGKLTLKEYENVVGGQPLEKVRELFDLTDRNKNGSMTFFEFTKGGPENNNQFDPITLFLQSDTDFNSELSHAEIMAGTPAWQHGLSKHYLKAFDDDESGELSLAEYRLVPTANFFTTWQLSPYDKDGDGALSFSEFHTSKNVELAALAMHYFNRYDLNENGKLNLKEYTFYIDVEAAPIDLAFKYSDSNNDSMLTLNEMFGAYKGRTDQGAQEVIGRREELFLTSDADRDKKLSISEFRAGRELIRINGRNKSTNSLSAEIARNGEAGESSNRFWILIVFNVLLIAGVGWFVLFR